MSVAFVRQLGSQPGVQLDPLQDNTDGFASTNADQIFAVAMRATRGRIDKAFNVNGGNFKTKLGNGEALRTNALNEAHIHVYEALNNGAYGAVVSRLTTSAATLEYIVATTATASNVTTTSYSTAAALPSSYLFALKHLECFNDGIIVAYHADALTDDNGTPIANPAVTLRLLDPATEAVLYEFDGSFDPTAVDDYGQSLYLTDVISNQTDLLQATIFAGAAVAVTSDAYGRDASGADKWATSGVLLYFVEGGTAYQASDYARAVTALNPTALDYGYIVSGGSQAIALLSALGNLAYDVNRCFKLDVPGTLTPDAAIAWVAQLGLNTQYCHVFWAPLQSNDPLGINGKVTIGTATLNTAFACGRNAVQDANGFAAKNYPIAGKAWPVNRTGVVQIYTPNKYELSDLADAKINPVILKKYNSGSLYVFNDSLTCAPTTVSYKKLISVAEMSSSIDDMVTRAADEYLQLPMAVFIKKFSDWLKETFTNAQAAGWLTPSAYLNGAAFQFSLVPDSVRPADKAQLRYSLHYDGTVRQIEVQQTLSK